MSLRDTAYDRYMKDISQYPRITKERESVLTSIIFAGEEPEYIEAAVDELVKANLRLVVHCGKSFSSFVYGSSTSITAMDLIAEGNLALVQAAQNYNPQYHTEEHAVPISFSTYACKCITNAMRKAFRKAKFIHIPDHHYGYWKQIKELKAEFSENLTDSIMQERLDIGSSRLQIIKMGLESSTVMLEDFAAEDGESNWCDIIPDEKAESPQEVTASKDLCEYLLSSLHSLPPRTRDMISLMFFDEDHFTLQDLSKRFGVSKERCRQVCIRGLSQLKAHMKTTWSPVDQEVLLSSFDVDSKMAKYSVYLEAVAS